ncbi:MAG: stage III sporulation protein AA, partial [Firmicutes bacterium]|nr:stage III sporulation protein AA [Bacillota bacterium]
LEELKEGFVTLPGGHRVGVIGRAVCRQGRIETIVEISGLNFRRARDMHGIAAPLIEQLPKWPCSVLIAAPPRAGKTTLLRDVIRLASQSAWRTVVVDERSEIGALAQGSVGFDLGLHTDVLDGWPKEEGLLAALRTLGPDLIAVDELSNDAERQAVQQARHAGVHVLATMHAEADSTFFVQKKEWLKAFDAVVFLSRRDGAGTLQSIYLPALKKEVQVCGG